MTAWISRLVALATLRPRLVLVLVGLLTVISAVYASGHFAMSTDTADLISADTSWRRDEAAVDAAFPQRQDQLVVLIEAATPELAEMADHALAERMASRRDIVRRVDLADYSPFLAQNGLLFLSRPEVATVTSRLVAAQPILGPLASDPSLRGVMDALSAALDGVKGGSADPEKLRPMIAAMADAAEAATHGRQAAFSWEALMNGASGATAAPRQRILLVSIRPDYGALEPGAEAEDAVRQAARELQLDAAHGVSVRLTGDIPLSDEEFSSLEENAGLVAGVMALAAVLMLWLATRSVRMLAGILATTVAGLVVTAALGLLMIGRFNLISVAFIPLFVGLGVDFGIQLMVRFREERLSHPDVAPALQRAARSIGPALIVAAGAITLGFFAFLPTSYVGVAQLGAIAGVGMIVALLCTATLLPALIMVLRPGLQELAVGFAWFAPVDAFLMKRRRLVLGAFGLAVLASVALLPAVRFDFNPLHLRNPKGEAMLALKALLDNPDMTPNAIDVLAPSLAAADRTAARLDALPEVGQTVTLSSFVPDDQPAKLAVIQDASLLLDTAVSPLDIKPAPSDEETVQALAEAASKLRTDLPVGPWSADAGRLAEDLQRLAAAPPAQRRMFEAAVVRPLAGFLDRIRNLLSAQPVTLQSLPADLVRDWVAPNGKARVEATPRKGSTDNRSLERFSRAVRRVAPHASGGPISIQEAARTIAGAFIEAGVLSLLAVAALLYWKLRSIREVGFTLAPVVLSGFLTLATCVLIGQPINFANIIAFPLLFGVGVAFHIYFVMAWREGATNLLQSSLTRAVLFSALTTGVAFGALWLSRHPGTASMGKILMISIIWTLVCALVFEPALLGPPAAARMKA